MRQYPGQKARIDAAFAATMQAIPDNPRKGGGHRFRREGRGRRFRRTCRATRQTCPTHTARSPRLAYGCRPRRRCFPQYATAKPWGMESASQFRPGPPPALNSALYARDYNETKEMGGAKSTKRTDAQSDAVRFWTQANLGPAWFQAAAQASAARGSPLAENARLFALMSMALANCFIVDWDAKFQYNFWRPITAIRNGDQDGNDATERDAGWQPLNATPMHPEYPVAGGDQRRCGERRSGSGFRQRAGRLRRDRYLPTRACRANSPALRRWPRSTKRCASGAAFISAIRWRSATRWAARSPTISSRTR